MKVSIIIPAHNEEKRIGKTLSLYSNYFEDLKKSNILDYEVLVVINNTKDKTEEIVSTYKNISYINLKKGGKGYAVVQGFKEALKKDFDLIGFVDADAATLPKEFYNLIRKINGADGAIASRYLKGSILHPKQSIKRIIASRIYNIFIRSILFLPYKDTQCGAKLFKFSALKKTLPRITFSKYAFDVDLLFAFKKQGFKIKEVPTTWSHRKDEKIRFFSSGFWMTLAIIRLRLINSPFSGFVLFYDKILNPTWKSRNKN